MPPPIPLSGSPSRYLCGSHSGSASSAANGGLIASHASSGEAALAISARTRAMNCADDRRVEEVLVGVHARAAAIAAWP